MKRKRGALYYLKRDFWLYLCVLPVILYYFIFKYLPMAGIVMAFQDYNIFKGILGSEFVGMENFQKHPGAEPGDPGGQLSADDYAGSDAK